MPVLDLFFVCFSLFCHVHRYFKRFPHLIFLKKMFVTGIKRRLLFSIISLLLYTFSPAIYKFLTSLRGGVRFLLDYEASFAPLL